MKKIFLLWSIISLGFTVCAQNSVMTYTFDGNFKESRRSGPELVPICTGTFDKEALPDYNIIHSVYRFDENCGFYYDDSLSGFIRSGNYTIELYFKLSDLGRWKRVIDFKSRSSDNGCYVLNGELNFYNIATSDGAPFSTDSFSHYVISRDGSTKEVKMYGDGNQFITFTDSNDDAVYDSGKKLRFFQDDLVVADEAASGSIAFLRIYNYPLDSAEVKNAYDSLQDKLTTGIKEPADFPVGLFPNPAKDNLTITLPDGRQNVQYVIIDLQGRTQQSGTLFQNKNKLSVENLTPGIYQLKIQNKKGNFIVRKLVKL